MPRGYAREEIFLQVSGRRSPDARVPALRLPLKAIEYPPGALRAVRRVRA